MSVAQSALAQPRVAVTGATGFIGTHLIERLKRGGASVRALTRTARASQRDDVAWVKGDLATGVGVERLVDGADMVIHCAGAVRGARPADFDDINVDGTRRLVDAAQRSGVTRLLSVSSLAAREPRLSMYAASKRRGEDIVKNDRLAWTIIRPPAVYGPGDKELLPLFKLMLKGIAVVPGHTGRTSLIYVTDLADAIVAWVRAPTIARVCLEIDDGTPNGYDWSEMIRIATEIRGANVLRIDVPRAMLGGIGAVNLGLGRVFHGTPMLTSGKVRELFHRDWVCRTDAARAALPWTPAIQFAEGLRLSLPKSR
jgi:nucleoside-diphosphate-sugar epimerase